eukprot:TRINITY_DN4095_c0_g3_i1.p1 TRINITY_DN4095_c0_g3~~TRINITY_DN4095_c0_g3_i1.p1  ORF type:complete len:254 (-),score=15.11 TRINITY_DN4095_c0_g3_i1:213-953(-)
MSRNFAQLQEEGTELTQSGEIHFGYLDPQPDGTEVDPDLICSICQCPFTNAMRSSNCGHTFCKDCISTWAKINQTCPLDHIALDKMQPDRIANNMTEKLVVYCKLCDRWLGKKSEMATHLKDEHQIQTRINHDTEEFSFPQTQMEEITQNVVVQVEERTCHFHTEVPSQFNCRKCGKSICWDCVAMPSLCVECFHIYMRRVCILIFIICVPLILLFSVFKILGIRLALGAVEDKKKKEKKKKEKKK